MATQTVYDYALFFEDGHKEGFYLLYGPDDNEERFITNWRENPYLRRFFEETPVAATAFDELDKIHSLGFVMVNPPREMEV